MQPRAAEVDVVEIMRRKVCAVNLPPARLTSSNVDPEISACRASCFPQVIVGFMGCSLLPVVMSGCRRPGRDGGSAVPSAPV